MIVVGLTGGIGSGKSTVAQIWEKLGATVVKADDLAKKLMVTDKQLISEIKQTFGAESYFENGELNRKFLADESFKKGRVAELNALVHPAVFRWFERQKIEEKNKGTQVLVREAAILLDKGRPEGFDIIVVVSALEPIRIKRVLNRDKSNEAEIKARIQKQMSQQIMESFADIIIENNSDLANLEEIATQVFNQIVTWDQK